MTGGKTSSKHHLRRKLGRWQARDERQDDTSKY